MQFNIHEAKTQFSLLVEKALRGEEIIIAKHGKPLLRLTPIESGQGQRPVGLHSQPLEAAEIQAALEPLEENALADWYK